MISVGLRDLKNRLSEYVRLVRQGEDVLVTDRGEVVAEIRRVGSPRPDEPYAGLEELACRGLARLGEKNRPDLYPRMPSVMRPGEVFDLLDEERGTT